MNMNMNMNVELDEVVSEDVTDAALELAAVGGPGKGFTNLFTAGGRGCNPC